jgi:hypothetical protein
VQGWTKTYNEIINLHSVNLSNKASLNALLLLDRIDEKKGHAYQHHKKILYDGGYHWMKLLSLKTLLILPFFDFIETEFIITEKVILMKKNSKNEYFWLNDKLYYRASYSILGSLFNYGTFTLSQGGGGFGSKPTEHVYKKVKNAKLFMATLDNYNIKRY